VTTAAIDSITRFSTGTRPQDVKTFVSLQQQHSSLSVDFKLIHVLGHTGLKGNGTADNLANDVAHQLLRGEISAARTISRPVAFEVARDISHKSWQRSWDYGYCTYTYNIIPSVQTKVLFQNDRDIGISYMSGCSFMTPCWKMTAIELVPIVSFVNVVRAEKLQNISCFTVVCTKYQHIRKDTVESALDILSCSEKSSLIENLEVLLLSPFIDGVTKSENITIKDLLFEFLSSTNRPL